MRPSWPIPLTFLSVFAFLSIYVLPFAFPSVAAMVLFLFSEMEPSVHSTSSLESHSSSFSSHVIESSMERLKLSSSLGTFRHFKHTPQDRLLSRSKVHVVPQQTENRVSLCFTPVLKTGVIATTKIMANREYSIQRHYITKNTNPAQRERESHDTE